MIWTWKSGPRLLRRARTGLTTLALAAAFQPAAFSADSHCKLGKMAEFPITMRGLRPLMTAGINGTDVQFVLDSGAFYSTISPASAAELRLETHFAPVGFYMRGVGGGRADVSIATVKTFTLAGVPIKNVEFLVGGSEFGAGSVGLLGQNILHLGDVEYDLGNGVVRLMKPIDCRNTVLAYWATASTPYSVLSIDAPNGLDRHTGGTAYVNGAEIRVEFDTGAGSSVLSLRAAARAGVKPDSPGVVYAGDSYGIGKTTYPTYIAPFASFKIGDEEIKNTRLRIGDIDLPNADMLLGPDFFLSHHIYVANSQRKLYFTYNGGPVFNLAVRHPTAEDAPPVEPAQLQTGLSPSSPGNEAPSAVPHDQEAADLSRRGTAAAARGDLEHAIADLTQACELAPEVPEYLYQRGLAHLQNKQPDLAMTDFDRALELRSNDAQVLLARAHLWFRRGDSSRAAADLAAADAAASRESDLRYQMALGYEAIDLPGSAIKQYDLWIEFHPVDARYPRALNGRCRARALQGEELPLALKDCDTAERRVQKSSPEFAKILDSRALVLLRMGSFDKSIADYNASLKINPKNPWGLYGRGIDELRLNKASEGQADIERAKSLWPQVANEFSRRGIAP
ncbi:MAG TPA: aspartyl protease family protein [Steroidobacteraceae bacterium]